MPRYCLNCLPLMKTSSPGLSSQPARSEPSITTSAPATRALAMSPEYCRPPSPITGTPAARAASDGLVDRGHLRHADAGDDAGRADRARPDADLDAVGAGLDQRLGARAGGDVAADDVDLRRGRLVLQPLDHLDDAARVAVRGVDEQRVDAGLDERHRALPRVAEEADGRTDPEPAGGVLGRVGILLALGEVLDRDQPAQPAGRRRPAAASRPCAGAAAPWRRPRRCRPAR